MPCELVARSVIREQRGKIYLPDEHFQDMVSEEEATQRWLDDGGTSATSEIKDKGLSSSQEEPVAV